MLCVSAKETPLAFESLEDLLGRLIGEAPSEEFLGDLVWSKRVELPAWPGLRFPRSIEAIEEGQKGPENFLVLYPREHWDLVSMAEKITFGLQCVKLRPQMLLPQDASRVLEIPTVNVIKCLVVQIALFVDDSHVHDPMPFAQEDNVSRFDFFTEAPDGAQLLSREHARNKRRVPTQVKLAGVSRAREHKIELDKEVRKVAAAIPGSDLPHNKRTRRRHVLLPFLPALDASCATTEIITAPPSPC